MTIPTPDAFREALRKVLDPRGDGGRVEIPTHPQRDDDGETRAFARELFGPKPDRTRPDHGTDPDWMRSVNNLFSNHQK